MTRTAFLLPVLDKWLWYAPLHGAAALLNRSAARLLRERGDRNLPGELGELRDLTQAAPAHPPRPLEGELIPALLGIIPTRGCNMSCVYCNFGGAAARRDVMPPELAAAAVDWAAGQRAKAGEGTFPVQFFGGEPFLAQDLVEIVVHRARHVSSEHGLTPWFDASTNGLFNERQRQFIGDYFDGVVLSLDGPPEFQDRYRPVTKGRPSSAMVERNARALSEMPLELCLRMCVTQESVNEMARIARWMIGSFNPSTIDFETLTPGELARQAGLAPPDPYQFAVQAEHVFQLAEAAGVKAVYAAAETGVPRLSFCPVGRDAVIVSPNGRLSACYLPPEEWRQRGLNLDIGQLRPDRGVTIFPEALVKVRRLAADKPRCERCFCQYTCAGGCHVNPPGSGDREYADFCIQTRLITAGRLLRDLGFAAVHRELLGDRSAMERIAQNPGDSLNDATDGG